MQDKYPDVFYENLWDRKYMRQVCGRFSPMALRCSLMITPLRVSKRQETYLKDNYVDLYEPPGGRTSWLIRYQNKCMTPWYVSSGAG
jgi:hypothetical protein